LRILVSWLREFVDVTEDPAALADTLTMRGFEVAAIEQPPAGPLAPAGTRLPRRSPEGEGGPDAVIDLEITANRPDCLSVVGIAREVATAYQLPLRNVPPGLDHAQSRPTAVTAEAAGLKVVLDDADRCPRYAAAVADVKIAASPDWLANRLLAAGVRPISNVVDVTNYVLIELGHPLHAFDLARLAGHTLLIRTARPSEQLRTLDGEARTLDSDMLVIADAESAQAIAGVMGGAASEVWGGTTAIAIESAYFKPSNVRRTSKRLGLKTEASARFERGANIDAPVVALTRAVDLLEKIGAGRSRGGVIDCYPAPRQPARVALRRARVGHLLGRPIADDIIDRVLTGLGFRPQRAADAWNSTVPGWRVDVSREVDLIEEVARHDGYDKIPNTFPAQTTMPGRSDPRIERDALVRGVLTAAGFSEAQTFAFVEAAAAAPFAGGSETVPIAYPLSEKFAVLRPSLLAGIVDSIAYNRRREQKDVRLFEIGATFSAESGEHRALAFGWSGTAVSEHWSRQPRPVDFFDVKGVAERVATALRVPVRFAPAVVSYLVEGRTAAMLHGDTQVGLIGQLSPSIAEGRDLPAGEEIYVAELDLDSLPRQVPTDVRAEPLPRYPSVARDVSIVVAEALPAEAVRGTIVAAAPPTLVGVREFDRYNGKGIPEGQVSISLHLTFRAAERTLTDAEVQEAMDAIIDALRRERHAVRR
jgi:phenylalanyl-tRNA synthetase beta chain